MTSSKPSAFVIMPFDAEFLDVYNQFLKPVLEESGYRVERADDILSQQNILTDVLQGINDADLIIADLTGENPNVFYELALAHAEEKPVILLTQSIEDVPFDLRPYRKLEYDTRFSGIDVAKQTLRALAEGFRDKTIPFGNPVTDFRSTHGMPFPTKKDAPSKPPNQDDRGYIDHFLDINEGYRGITELIQQVGTNLNKLTADLQIATTDFDQIGSNPNNSAPTAARTVARRLAARIESFNSRLEAANTEYTSIADGIDDSLEFVIAYQTQQLEGTDPSIEKEKATLREFLVTAEFARNSQLGLATQMDQVPRFERRLNRELLQGSQEVRTMANNIDRTIASINRAINAGA